MNVKTLEKGNDGMDIKTKYHGEITIAEEDILYFEKGIPGFPAETKFVMIPLTDDGLFQVLQSTSNQDIGFITTDPFFFKKDYEFRIDDSVVESLELQDEKDVNVIVIITLHEPFNQSTANLQAPVVINTKNGKARQVILNNTTYQTKHPLFAEEPVSAKEWNAMLVLSRKKGQSIKIGDDIEITIVALANDQVKIGIQAPKNVEILRQELFEEIQAENKAATASVDDLLTNIKNLPNLNK